MTMRPNAPTALKCPVLSCFYNHLVARQPEIVDYTVLERLRLLAPLGIHTTDTALDMLYLLSLAVLHPEPKA
jgi:hypothetical protein